MRLAKSGSSRFGGGDGGVLRTCGGGMGSTLEAAGFGGAGLSSAAGSSSEDILIMGKESPGNDDVINVCLVIDAVKAADPCRSAVIRRNWRMENMINEFFGAILYLDR